MRTWIIGSAGDCDLVVARPTVSGRHCRLTETPGGFLLEDLGSSNGTYVNGMRIGSATRVSPADAITLGLTILMPWPATAGAPGVTVIGIGRDPDNTIVIDDPRVSGRHARLLVIAGSKALIEDLGSSNGTFVNSPDRRVTQAVPITQSDVLYLGSLAIPAARLLPAQPKLETAVVPPMAPLAPPRLAPAPRPLPVPVVAPAPIVTPARVPVPAPVVTPTPVAAQVPVAAPVPVAVSAPTQAPPRTARAFDHGGAIFLLVEATVLAILVVLIFGRQAAAVIAETNGVSDAQGIAATTFALGVAAIVLGGSLAVWAAIAG